MKHNWLIQRNRDRLIVFCNGWGMDDRPFTAIPSEEFDVLHIYDHRPPWTTEPLLSRIRRYTAPVLVSWSMGVWAAHHYFEKTAPIFSAAIAVNGTLCPIHSRYGIPQELFAGTMSGWSEPARRKFYSRLCGNRAVWDNFSGQFPARDCADQRDELAFYLENADCINKSDSIYSHVVVGDKDRIVRTENQLSFWKTDKTTLVPGSHFLFYDYSSWDHFVHFFTAQTMNVPSQEQAENASNRS
ncbi:pimeloyl-ACP methyl esterase BioG family protein [Desulforhopalus singaporensis]|uniref:Biotin synthesis protein BioG n=1 Tax=Desulforhopalus singaporensis TaxID=91360 RepID=A0A1H0VEB3_9BACT|nr:pimeloyl-ACP methyl esterase BioG family protein [Desulforhopalus singaporensis]SDP76714.1 biotin synthesis protein BioG [Desulforhopalus singaporensis]